MERLLFESLKMKEPSLVYKEETFDLSVVWSWIVRCFFWLTFAKKKKISQR